MEGETNEKYILISGQFVPLPEHEVYSGSIGVPETMCLSPRGGVKAGEIEEVHIALVAVAQHPLYNNCHGVCGNYNRQDLCHTRMAKYRGMEAPVCIGRLWTTDEFGRWIEII